LYRFPPKAVRTCRFAAYRGPPIRLDELLYKPEQSLVHQSVHAEERDEPLNGDGWGVGWYQHDVTPEPALYRSTSPAWSDENMRLVAPAVESSLGFAHVRDASAGGPSSSSTATPSSAVLGAWTDLSMPDVRSHLGP
jgi:predicted glutamine amidotransferase